MVPQQAGELADRPKADRPSLMIVEVAGQSQDSLRNFFSDQGFRTLVTQDPQRALMRFKTHPRPDFLLLSAQVLQGAALEAFNAFSRDPYLARVPVLIIGSAKQQDFFSAEARTDDFRKVLLMPFKASTLSNVVKELITLAQKKPGSA
jgi:CheY-like chemotaxis protein